MNKRRKKRKIYLKKDDIILSILFIVISIISFLIFSFWGLLIIPIMLLFIFIYYNSNVIANIIRGKKELKSVLLETEKIDMIKLDEKDVDDGMGKKKKITKHKKLKNINKKTKIKWWKKILAFLIILCIAGILSVAGLVAYIVISTSKFDPEALAYADQTVVYDIDGNAITTLGREKRESVTYDELPQVLIDAVIATEDSRYFQHNGVDMARFLKATVGNLIGSNNAGGASTLTMQVVKNNLTSTEKSIIRKLKDIYLSVFYLEKEYSKEEIFEFYVNDGLLGGNVYGVGQASEYYFGKDVSELTLTEAAIIAGLFQSPNGYDPYKYPEKTAERRKIVLKLMVKHRYITQEEADVANAIDVTSLLAGNAEETSYQGFIDTVIDEVIEKTGDNPSLVPMKIYTTMEKSIQDGIDKALSGETYDWENEVVQAGIAVVNVKTGAISAIGAGRNREGERTYNYATMAKRQPGSTAKPLFDYGPGFEYNNFSTYTLFTDEPWTYTNGPSVSNWDGGYSGVVTLKYAVAFSRNIPALKAFQQISNKNIYNFVTSLGIEPELENGGTSVHEAHAIGGFTGITPLQMAAAYSGFASGGYYTEPYTVTKIEYRSTGTTKEFKSTKERVMSDSTAYLMNATLQYAAENGFSGGARVYGSTVAVKTGTTNFSEDILEKYHLPSNAVNDIWTVAYTPDYSIALWYGYKETTSEYYNTSNYYKEKLMGNVMTYIPTNNSGFTMPDTVVSSQVESGSWPAKLPSSYTPSDLIATEYFKKGTQPTEISERFEKLDDVTNLKANTTSNGKIKLTWDAEIPTVLTTDYLNTYFGQSMFGNSTASLVQDRIQYNKNTLGDIGFGIYVQNSSGVLSYVDFTTDKSYSYAPTTNGNITLVVKQEYSKFKSNASSGKSVKTASSGVITKDEISINIINGSNQTFNNGSFTENGITIKYGTKNISTSATIKYSVLNSQNKNILATSSSKAVEELLNSSENGTYYIKYNVVYEDAEGSATKTVIIK